MNRVLYPSGDEVKPGDRIDIDGEPGQHRVCDHRGDRRTSEGLVPGEFPAGGVMLTATGFGSVFLSGSAIDEDLELIARSDGVPT